MSCCTPTGSASHTSDTWPPTKPRYADSVHNLYAVDVAVYHQNKKHHSILAMPCHVPEDSLTWSWSSPLELAFNDTMSCIFFGTPDPYNGFWGRIFITLKCGGGKWYFAEVKRIPMKFVLLT